ncbi:MAG: sulfatase family protein [Anaerolineae bacterium]
MRVLYIDLDCCRADHLGANGYHRPTSPNLDRLAGDGVSFDRCYCANSPCVPSRASLFSGRFGFNNGVVAHHGSGERFRPIADAHRRDPKRPTLAQHLWQQGRKTVSFSSFADRHAAWWFADGWQELHNFTRKRGQERGNEVNAAFIPWLRENGRADDWFVHLHYWDIHSHYRVPENWVERFRDQPPPAWPDQETISRQQTLYGPRTPVDLYTGYENASGGGYARPVSYMPDAIRTVDDFRMLIDGYDASIAYVDYHVGQVLEVLADLGVLDDTAIVVSGDHGDSFGEHGQYMDHGIANEAVHNIPMIVRWPGVTRPGRCSGFVYGMDLAPTLCELLGYPVPAGWDGRSFAPALRGEPFAGQPYLVLDHGIYTFTRAVRTPDWLLIQVLHPGLYPYDEPLMLHDMHADPHQQVNLAAERPDVVGQLLAHLAEWRQTQIQAGGAPDPLEGMVATGPFLYYTPAQMIARLERTGRGHLVPDLKARLARYGTPV